MFIIGLMKVFVLTFGILTLLMICANVGAQVSNDDCFTAIEINDLSSFCSSEFTNVNSLSSIDGSPSCWSLGDEESDVWYSFRPAKPGLLLRFFGRSENSTYTLDNVGLVLYEGRCSSFSEVFCERRSDGTEDIFEKVVTNLTIGRNYYVRVSSSSSSAGTFQLCLTDFIPVPEPEQDCATAVVLCDKNAFTIEKLQGFGQFSDEARGSCLDGITPDSPPTQTPDQTETGSVWYKWTARTSGSLTFTLTPNSDDPEEDLDFAVYRLPGGINDCDAKELLICMASGANFGLNAADDTPCKGPTGLREGEDDTMEFAGCSFGDNNFAAPLQMIQGESYALIVNNFSQSGFGFSINFGGTGEFLGPEPDFEFTTVDNFECDKTITFENLSSSLTDSIIDYRWRFGEGAQPEETRGIGPHDVVYESFGDKRAVLTVESSRGCLVTKFLDLEVEPCCDDFSQLELNPEVQDLTCFGSDDGRIIADAINGSPEYLFALDGGPFQPNAIFGNLSIGRYQLSVIDIKGCETSEEFQIEQPDEIELFLSSLLDSVQLGEGTQIFSDFSPIDRILMYQWSPQDGLSCAECPNPMVIPPGSTTYTLVVTDQDGCMQSEDITILTNNVKFFDAPNIISLNPDNAENGIFKVIGNIAVRNVEILRILDRWGGEVYRATEFELQDSQYQGWNGVVLPSGKKVNPGVYVWIAKVIFIDNQVQNYAGTITVVD